MNQIKGKIRAGKIAGSIGSGVDYYKGDKGEDGYTPIKGVDYFTEEDIAEIVSQIDTGSNIEIAVSTSMSDWTRGKVVDAATLKTVNQNTNANITAAGSAIQEVMQALNYKADEADLAAVATSGSYNDLTNKPSIITETRVNELIDAKLGVIENGTY